MFRSYYVNDSNGNIEIEISPKQLGGFTVHYPKYEQQKNILHANSCFVRVTMEQLGMLLFAYNPEEYFKFCEFYKSQVTDKEVM